MAFDLSVKTLQGKFFKVSVEPSDTIAVVKGKLSKVEAGAPGAQRLIFGGKILEDGKTVGDYNLSAAQPLFLVINQDEAKKKAEAEAKAKAESEAKAKAEKDKVDAEAKKKADEEAKKKAEAEAKAKAEADQKAAEAKNNDPKEVARLVEAITKKITAAKSVNELAAMLEAEAKAIKPAAAPAPAPAAGAAAAAAGAKPAAAGAVAAGGDPAAEWTCAQCTVQNKPGTRFCEVCEAPNPAMRAVMVGGRGGRPAPAGGAAGGGGAPAGPWTCAACTFAENPGGSFDCQMCGNPNPDAPPMPAGMGGGFPFMGRGGGAGGLGALAGLVGPDGQPISEEQLRAALMAHLARGGQLPGAGDFGDDGGDGGDDGGGYDDGAGGRGGHGGGAGGF